jgi:hypothetical protein
LQIVNDDGDEPAGMNRFGLDRPGNALAAGQPEDDPHRTAA